MLPTRLPDIQATDLVRLVDTEQIDWEDDIGHPKIRRLVSLLGRDA
jgi:hypothetical protein